MKLKSYTCPSCGADLQVDSETETTVCEYCGQPFVRDIAAEGNGSQGHFKTVFVTVVVVLVIMLGTLIPLLASFVSDSDEQTAERREPYAISYIG